MIETKFRWKKLIRDVLNKIAGLKGIIGDSFSENDVIIQTPPRPELGDLAFPMFPYAKKLRASPLEIAELVSIELNKNKDSLLSAEVVNEGPYINIKLPKSNFSKYTLHKILNEKTKFGTSQTLAGQKIMLEFSCPNTNKPLHLGHLRNDAIGESVSNILKANGAEVRKVNLINDRGIHICKSMLAYQKFGKGSDPESEGVKGDHFVGKFYVMFDKWARENIDAENRARELLLKWERGDPEITELWRRMNNWAVSGINETYRRTGVSFDKVYYESETYGRGKEEVLKGLERKIFYRDEESTIWVDLKEIDLDKKVLLRKDGTSLYLTQDVGTAVIRHEDWPFDRLIYVVASEQKYHFIVLFYVLKKLGFEWAENLYHLSYGMVNLPEGKMKSREGTVVDADNLLDQLIAIATEEIKSRGREKEVKNLKQTSEKIAMGALNYYLLQVSPSKDMIFIPEESISFTGNTGPYLQYMGARISSMLRKFEDRKDKFKDGAFKPELLTVKEEWEIVKLLAMYPEETEKAAEELNPSIITNYLYNLSRVFSRYYHDNPVLHNKDPNLVVTRITLVKAVLQVLKNAFTLVGIPFLENM